MAFSQLFNRPTTEHLPLFMKQISIIIISYNRPADALALLQNLVSLKGVGMLVAEIILLNNASTESYTDVEAFCEMGHPCNIRYIKHEENLGVARGRNYAIGESTGELLFLLDDDAVLQNSDALLQVAALFNADQSGTIGAAACKVLYYGTGAMQQTAFPHKDFKRLQQAPFFETYYFTGCAHVLRRSAIEKTGLYPEDFFYGMEEYDLAYRLLLYHYQIVYTASVVVLHKESPLGRKPKAEKLRMMWVNKSKVAWRYLRWYHFAGTAIMWSLFALLKSGFNLKEWLNGWMAISRIFVKERKTTLPKKAMDHLHHLNARLWY